MRKPGTDEQNVQMSDVLCDFCRREWTEDLPMVEGHQGSCICGKCLTVAYVEVVMNRHAPEIGEFMCALCLESTPDRAALNRGDEPGWRSPAHADAAICKRCIKQTAGVLTKDEESGWTRPA
jgi:hypothetical protein